MRTLISSVLMLAAVVSLEAAGPVPPAPESRIVATAVGEATAIRVDGELNDAVWQNAPPITGFRQRDPHDGAAATYETDARVAYDATSLYIAVQAFDPEPGKIVGIRTRRDEGSPSDWVSVLVDSFHDRRSAFEFAVNPAGVKQDSYWFNDTNNDQGWDAVWDVAVSRSERGWRAEFRIPFSQLRYRPSESSTFGLAIVRKIGRLNETTTWPLLSKNANGYVSSFGELDRPAARSLPEAARNCSVCRRRRENAAGRARQSAHKNHGPERLDRRGREIRASARAHLDRHHQPGLRTGGSRPGGRQSFRLRDILFRAAPVFRGRLRHFQLRRGLQRWQLQRPVLLTPDRPHAAGQRRRTRRRVFSGACADHDPWRDKTNRTHRRVLDRCPERDYLG